jgi:DNA polymerase-1
MAKHSLKDLSWGEKQTGVIFRFLRQVFKLAEKFKTNKFVFVWDSRSSLRKEIYPAYKSNRRKEKTPEEKEIDDVAYAQFNLLKDTILPSLGFKNIFEFEGFAADDILAEIIFTYEDDFIIVSADEDLYQLLIDDAVSIYNLYKKEEYSRQDFIDEYGILPEQWSELKCLTGCTTDFVKGIEGIGEKTALKFLKGLIPQSPKTKKILESKRLIEKNSRLVKLPFENTPDVNLNFEETLSFDSFVEVCNKCGFNFFLQSKNIRKWTDYFNLI